MDGKHPLHGESIHQTGCDGSKTGFTEFKHTQDGVYKTLMWNKERGSHWGNVTVVDGRITKIEVDALKGGE